MAFSDKYYIKHCLRQIEKKFSFETENGSTQRNLILLSQRIEEKTGVKISLSTLKRIWKSEFKQIPQIATLNALAAMLEYNDWQDFKLANKKAVKRFPVFKLIIVFGVSISIIGLFLLFRNPGNKEMNKPKINNPIHFTAEKTVYKGVPTTVVFNYDISGVEAENFYFNQSWNGYHKVKIDKESKVYTNIYYESGYHRARILADDSKVAMLPIHILSDGWEPHIYYSYKDKVPIDFKGEDYINKGVLNINESLLRKKHVDFSKGFFLRVSNSQQFDVHTDNFQFETRIKLDSLQNSICPWFNLILVNEKHIFMLTMHKKGCEEHAYYKLGEVERGGKTSDLSALGCNLFEWQNIGIKVKDKHATILINGKPEFEETFNEDFGKLTALIYVFESIGSIDFVRLYNENKNIVFADDFE
jgi:hypothetical protein